MAVTVPRQQRPAAKGEQRRELRLPYAPAIRLLSVMPTWQHGDIIVETLGVLQNVQQSGCCAIAVFGELLHRDLREPTVANSAATYRDWPPPSKI